MKTQGMLAVLVIAIPMAAGAGPSDRMQKAQDRREIRTDKAQRFDDWRDLNRLQGVLAKFDAARARQDFAGLNAAEAELRALIAREVSEGQAELAQAKAEVRRDTREVRSENRDVRNDLAQGKTGQAMNDIHDKRDDLRDRRDDIRDAKVERAELVRVRGIGVEMQTLAGRVDPWSLNRKRALIGELIDLSKREMAQDRREIHEDHRELREDRRETREDRRNGR